MLQLSLGYWKEKLLENAGKNLLIILVDSILPKKRIVALFMAPLNVLLRVFANALSMFPRDTKVTYNCS